MRIGEMLFLFIILIGVSICILLDMNFRNDKTMWIDTNHPALTGIK